MSCTAGILYAFPIRLHMRGKSWNVVAALLPLTKACLDMHASKQLVDVLANPLLNDIHGLMTVHAERNREEERVMTAKH